MINYFTQYVGKCFIHCKRYTLAYERYINMFVARKHEANISFYRGMYRPMIEN